MLKNDIAIIPKAYDIRVNNVLVVESDRLYFVIPLIRLEGVEIREFWKPLGHPLLDLFNYKKNNLKSRMFFVVGGQKEKGSVCQLCKHRFKGLTGTCNIERQEMSDDLCKPEFIDKPEPPVVQVKGGVFIPSKYFYKNYKPYLRERSIEDYGLENLLANEISA